MKRWIIFLLLCNLCTYYYKEVKFIQYILQIMTSNFPHHQNKLFIFHVLASIMFIEKRQDLLYSLLQLFHHIRSIWLIHSNNKVGCHVKSISFRLLAVQNILRILLFFFNSFFSFQYIISLIWISALLCV